MEGAKLIRFCKMMYVSTSLRQCALKWYHHYLCHPGGDRLANTLKAVCVWKGMVTQAWSIGKHCSQCQKFKRITTKYGYLEPKEAEMLGTWHTVCVDLVGKYSLTSKVKQLDSTIGECELQLLCMTFIDPATGWFEVTEVPLEDQTSARISRLCDMVWLSRYPRSKKVLYDNGSEFKRHFQPLLKTFG